MKRIVTALTLFTLTACSDAYVKGSADITCYEAGQVIYKGRSKGQIPKQRLSGRWEFVDLATNNVMRISAVCVVAY